MTADEIGNQLLTKASLTVDTVEDLLKLFKLCERRLAHQAEHTVAGVFRCHFQPSTHMVTNQLTGVFLCCLVGVGIATFVQQQIIAHPAADKTFLHSWQTVYNTIQFEKFCRIGVKVGTDAGVYARGPFAFRAEHMVLAAHTVHIGRRTTEVAEIPFEIVEFHHFSHFTQDALLTTAGDKFALMGADGAESTAAKASSVYVDGVLDHLISRDAFTLVFRVG